MQYDTIVVGGGFAGLAAATYLGRARRNVLVLDTGKPRNRFTPVSHGFLGQDGRAPLDILDDARSQLLSYPTISVRTAEAVTANVAEGGFAIGLANGEEITARTIVLAFGLSDTLPDIPGISDRWGKSVLHCPYCHGFEYGDRQLGVLYRDEMSVHQAQLIPEWGPTTLFLNGETLAEDHAEALQARGVSVETAPIVALEGAGTTLSSVRLKDGRNVGIEALYIAPRSVFAARLVEQLGVAWQDTPMGPLIETDTMQMTSLPGVFAAGDIAHAPHSVSFAVAGGVMAGTAAHRALVFG